MKLFDRFWRFLKNDCVLLENLFLELERSETRRAVSHDPSTNFRNVIQDLAHNIVESSQDCVTALGLASRVSLGLGAKLRMPR